MGIVETVVSEIEKIKERNRRVEREKAWETSWTRRVGITIATYIVAVVFLYSTGNKNPFLAAIFPAVAYILSTNSLTFLKEWWLKNNK